MNVENVTHYPILAACVARTKGPILELGVGLGSTPLLHYMAVDRLIISADTDAKWLDVFALGYSAPGAHEFVHVKPKAEGVAAGIQAWRDFSMIEAMQWGCALIDCAPGEARYELAMRLKDRCGLIVLHDSEVDHGAGGNYMYSKLVPHFQYQSEFRRMRPYTLIVSNRQPFGIEECDRTWSP